jgi:hypothetical protein
MLFLKIKVTSKKDQPYHYVTVPEFVAKFKKFHMGKSLKKQLSVPFNKRKIPKSALVFSEQSVPTLELLKISWSKEWLLMKRNSLSTFLKIVQVPESQLADHILTFLILLSLHAI